MVETWLQKCLSRHASCRPAPTYQNPRRVLDLDGPNVVLCDLPGENAQYVCLSHCWGDSRIITTTGATLTERMNGIDMNQLPRTFQEAIIYTRKLGIRYLWIDSLYAHGMPGKMYHADLKSDASSKIQKQTGRNRARSCPAYIPTHISHLRQPDRRATTEVYSSSIPKQ